MCRFVVISLISGDIYGVGRLLYTTVTVPLTALTVQYVLSVCHRKARRSHVSLRVYSTDTRSHYPSSAEIAVGVNF